MLPPNPIRLPSCSFSSHGNMYTLCKKERGEKRRSYSDKYVCSSKFCRTVSHNDIRCSVQFKAGGVLCFRIPKIAVLNHPKIRTKLPTQILKEAAGMASSEGIRLHLHSLFGPICSETSVTLG